MLASLSIDDATATKIVGGLCLAIGHLYLESFRCRRAHADSRVKLSGLEAAIQGCAIKDCPSRSASTFSLKPKNHE